MNVFRMGVSVRKRSVCSGDFEECRKGFGCKLLRDTILQAFACACTRACDFGASCCAKIVLIFKCALFYEYRHEYSTLSYEFIESVASISLNRVSRYCEFLGTDIKFDEVDSSNLFEFNFDLGRNTNFIETETLERV